MPGELRLGGRIVDLAHRQVLRGDERVSLTTHEAELLTYLARHAGRAVPRDELHAEVWGHAPGVASRAVDFTMVRLRAKVEDDPSAPVHLLTVHGVGYRFVPLDAEGESPPPPSLRPPAPPARTLAFGDRTVDLDAGTVVFGAETTPLSANERALLSWLARTPGCVVPRAELLREVWHARAETRSVDAAVDRLRAKIEEDPRRPRRLVTVPGRGLRLDLPRSNLPGEHTRLFGRDADVERLVALLDAGDRLVTLVGPAGIGKTRLARRCARRYDDVGAWFVDLSDCRDRAMLERTVADMLGVPLPASTPASVTLGRAFAGLGPAVVVLDNFEQVVDEAPGTVGAWRAAAPEARFLVTSREPLGLDGERTFALAPLGEADAIALLLDRAAARPGSDPDADRARHAAIVGHLDGLPLAIELAAARLGTLGSAGLLARLDQRLDLLVSARRDAPDRQATLRGAIRWSWDLLRDWEKAAFAQCAVFVGGFSLEAAEAVLDLRAWPDAPPVLDTIEALQNRSLLRAWEPPGLPGELRFGMFESVRAFAGERLAALPDREEVHARWKRWLLPVATTLAAGTDGPDPVRANRRLHLESDNLLAIARSGGPDDRASAVLALAPLLYDTGPWDLYKALLDEAIAARPQDLPLARLLTERADANRIRGRQAEAEADIARALVLAEPDDGAAAEALRTLSKVYKDRGRVEEAEAAARAAVERADRAGAPHSRAGTRMTFGLLLSHSGRLAAAEPVYAAALAIAEGAGARRLTGAIRSNLGALYTELGRHAAAEDTFARLLAEAVEEGTFGRVRTAMAHESLTRLYLEQGRLAEADAHTHSSNAIWHRNGDRNREAYGNARLALTALERGDLHAAETLLERARLVFQELGQIRGEGMATANLGILQHLRGNPATAARLHGVSGDRFRSVADLRMLCFVRILQGAAAADADALPDAEAAFDDAASLLASCSLDAAHGLYTLCLGHLDLARARATPAADPDAARTRARERLATAEGDPLPSQDLRLARRLLALAIGRPNVGFHVEHK